jgi:metal-sulfur cluster biosynthetic enzyme
MPTEQDVRNALISLIDPDFNKDIVSLGFVQNVRIQGDAVALDICLTTPACPVKNEFQRKAGEALRRTVPEPRKDGKASPLVGAVYSPGHRLLY